MTDQLLGKLPLDGMVNADLGVSPDPSTSAPSPRDELLWQAERALDLSQQFMEELVLQAIEARTAQEHPGVIQGIDWQRIWESTSGSSSLEEAIGRAVMAAASIAADIREGGSAEHLGDLALGTEQATARDSPTAPPSAYVETSPTVWLAPRIVEFAQAPPTTAVGNSAVGLDRSTPAEAVRVPERVDESWLEVVTKPPDEVLSAEEPLIGTTWVLKRVVTSPLAINYKRNQRLASFFGWVQFTGISLCLFVGWQLWGTSISQHHAQASLRQEFQARVERTAPRTPSAPTLVAEGVRLPEPPEGSVVAHLQIPAIGVDEYVVEGTAESDLDKGPGHYVGTAMPGQAGNVAIAGHRTTYGAPFNALNELSPGDPITLTTDSGEQLRYVVSQPPVAVAPSDVSVLNSFGDNRLTLTTCNPKYSSTQRLVVVAELATPVPATPVASSRAASATSRRGVAPSVAAGSVGWNWSYLPVVLLVLSLLAMLGVITERSKAYFGVRLRWLVAVPIWVAGMYLLFNYMTSLLPATL